MSERMDDPPEYVTEATCSIITKATDAKIEAQKLLVEAEIEGLRNTIKTSAALIVTFLTVLELILRVWKG